MSKILRRPMFRGGPVDSRGTGITSGLTDKPKRGLVNEPGGYAGELRTGGDVLKNVNRNFDLFYQDPNMDQLRAFQSLGMGNPFRDKFDLMGRLTRPAENSIFDKVVAAAPIVQEQEKFEEDTDKNQEILENKEFFSGNIDDVKSKIKDVKEINPNPEIVDPNGNVKTESTEISLDDIRAQADLFKELLGEDREKELKEARISDASDYALKFFEGSQKEGATVGSSAADVAAFATKGPSKTEKAKAGFKKTDQTATVMAINDYLQGKKSAAEIDKIIKMTDYKGNVNLTNQLKLIELKRGNIAERINEATVSKGLPASVGAIKSILREEGKEITTIPKGKEGTWKPSKEDEGNFIIEEETKNVYQIINGASVKLY